MLEFKNYHRMENVPFIVYADFECFIKPIQPCDQDDEKVILNHTKKHEPSSFCYYIKCFDDEVYESKLVSYTGEDAAKKFVEMLEEDIREITSIPEKKMIFEKKKKKKKKNYYTRKLNVGCVRKNLLMISKIIRLEIIAILLVGIVVPHTTYVILSIENLILRLWCFITLEGMIATYLYKRAKMALDRSPDILRLL